jgi:hypothetical protein
MKPISSDLLRDFFHAYNFGGRLKTPREATQYEYIFKAWTKNSRRGRNNKVGSLLIESIKFRDLTAKGRQLKTSSPKKADAAERTATLCLTSVPQPRAITRPDHL